METEPEMTQTQTRRFFITGVSSGLGRALAEQALADGHDVTGTVRTDRARETFEALGARATGIVLDVTDYAAIKPAVDRIEADQGPIDALVNNAGYGLEGTIEEQVQRYSDLWPKDEADLFDVDFQFIEDPVDGGLYYWVEGCFVWIYEDGFMEWT